MLYAMMAKPIDDSVFNKADYSMRKIMKDTQFMRNLSSLCDVEMWYEASNDSI